jgi:hypothetical protein
VNLLVRSYALNRRRFSRGAFSNCEPRCLGSARSRPSFHDLELEAAVKLEALGEIKRSLRSGTAVIGNRWLRDGPGVRTSDAGSAASAEALSCRWDQLTYPACTTPLESLVGLRTSIIGCGIAMACAGACYAQVPPTAAPDQATLLQTKDPKLAANKKLVFDMWRAIIQGRPY